MNNKRQEKKELQNASKAIRALLPDSQTLYHYILQALRQTKDFDPDIVEDVQLQLETCPNLQQLTRTTFIAMNLTSKKGKLFPPRAFDRKCRMNLQELMHQVIGILIRRNSQHDYKAKNLLTLGYRPILKSSDYQFQLANVHGVMCYFPNTCVTSLTQEKWGKLHQLLGDDLLIHLFLNFSIFLLLPSPSKAYIQVAGPNIKYQHSRKRPLASRESSSKRQKRCPFVINRRLLLYSKSSRLHYPEGFEKGLPISNNGARKLVQCIFRIPLNKKVQRLPKRLIQIVPLIRHYMVQLQRLKLERFIHFLRDDGTSLDKEHALFIGLQTYEAFEAEGYCSQEVAKPCPSPTAVCHDPEHFQSDLKHIQAHSNQITELLSQFTPHTQVFVLMLRLLMHLFPKEIWGCKHNRAIIFDGLWDFISLGKFQDFSSAKLTKKLKSTKVTWLLADSSNSIHACPNDLRKSQELLGVFVHWVFTSVVIPLLRACFYITEVEGNGSFDVRYFLHETWRKITKMAHFDLRQGLLKPASEENTSEDSLLTYSHVRLLPKPTGIRPIMNLSRRPTNAKMKSINQMLDNTFQILKHEISRNPSVLGATVSGHDGIFSKLRPLFKNWKDCPNCCNKELHFVSVDLRRCFDTIVQEKMYKIAASLISEKQYMIQSYWVVVPNQTSKTVHSKLVKSVGTPSDFAMFEEVAKSQCRRRDKGSVLVDNVVYKYVKAEEVLALLKEHIFQNTVSVEGEKYHQKVGIPQGSILSTLLCNLYYASMEKEKIHTAMAHISPSCRHEALLRYTDDFLFVSSDEERAFTFTRLMHRGVPDYGCSINSKKTQLSFKFVDQVAELQIDPFYSDPAEALLPWCGLLIDVKNLAIHFNFDKHLQAASARVGNVDDAALWIQKRLLFTVRFKVHPIFFDSTLYSAATIQRNLYQVFRLCAVKFSSFAHGLPLGIDANPEYFMKMLRNVISSTYGLIQSQLNHRSSSFLESKCHIRKSETTKLGLLAFAHTLKPLQQAHRLTMLLLRELPKHRHVRLVLKNFPLVLKKRVHRTQKRKGDLKMNYR